MTALLDEIHSLLVERNARETDPFEEVHASNAILLKQVDALQGKVDELQRENASMQLQFNQGGSGSGQGATNAALKNETRLRDKIEKLQEEFKDKSNAHQKDTASALKATKDLATIKDKNALLETAMAKVKDECKKKDKSIDKLKHQLEEAKSTTKLAEMQYDGLKETIRSLQEENDVVKEENRNLIDRLVSEKEKASDQVNILNEMVDKLKREVEMLRTLKLQDEQRRKWFGKAAVGDETNKETPKDKSSRKFGSQGVVLPSSPRHILQAHKGEAICVRYDSSGTDLVATSGSDSMVKVWDTNSGTLRATLRGSSGHSMTACDIAGGLAVGGGSDKMCRVWNLRTERMIHQLVGHANKITCVRLFGSERAVLTGSADRSMKVWDITRKTYRQTVTLRHSSTSYSVDVASDSFTTMSGHMDGGLRFWDVRTGERTAEIEGLHEGGITCVQFHPSNSTQVLTNGKDSCLKVVDVRTCTALHTLRHEDFRTNYTWSSCSFSGDGDYAAAISGSTGKLVVWRTSDGAVIKKLDGHTESAAGFAWGTGGTSGQQVASVDRSGRLILWA